MNRPTRPLTVTVATVATVAADVGVGASIEMQS
jgi:hypothetical protein